MIVSWSGSFCAPEPGAEEGLATPAQTSPARRAVPGNRRFRKPSNTWRLPCSHRTRSVHRTFHQSLGDRKEVRVAIKDFIFGEWRWGKFPALFQPGQIGFHTFFLGLSEEDINSLLIGIEQIVFSHQARTQVAELFVPWRFLG